MSLQTFDTGYSLKKLIYAGYSFSYINYRDLRLLGYTALKSKYIELEIRANFHRIITKCKIDIGTDKKEGFSPFILFEYINTGDDVDWKEKIGVRWYFDNSADYKTEKDDGNKRN